MSILKRIVEWNKERNIPKKFNLNTEAAHISEEFTELLRSNTEEEKVDACADIIVYATGSIWKLGYDPDKIMDEVLRHIESRKGSWDNKINKWVKEPAQKK